MSSTTLDSNTIYKTVACLEWVKLSVEAGKQVPSWAEVERWRDKCLEALDEIHSQIHWTDDEVGPGARYERLSETQGRRLGGLHIRARARPETLHRRGHSGGEDQ